MRRQTMTRCELRRAKLARTIKAVALALLLVVLLVTLSLTEADEPPKEIDRWAQFVAQERYYEALDLYGDVEGAVDAARAVYEKCQILT